MSKTAAIIIPLVAIAAAILGGVCFWRRRPEIMIRKWLNGKASDIDPKVGRVGPKGWLNYMMVGNEGRALTTAHGEGKDFSRFRHRVTAEIVHKILRDHGVGGKRNDRIKITLEDFVNLPNYIQRAQIQLGKKTSGKGMTTFEYHVQTKRGRLLVVEEIYDSKWKNLTLVSMYYR